MYDESLVTSDVCMRCGWCCHMRATMSSPFNVGKKRGRDFIKAILVDHPSVQLRKLDSEKNEIEVDVQCAKLKRDEQGFVSCSIYETRPDVCRTYSCLENANKKGIVLNEHFPIRKIVRELYGREIEVPSGG